MIEKKKEIPYMPEGREFEYVSIENPFMQEAKKASKELSTDKKHPTGAVIVKNNQVIVRWANQSLLKNDSLLKIHQKGVCTRKLLHIPSGQKYWLCPGCSAPAKHAESGSVIKARKEGIDTNGADMYLWGHWWCCHPCWDEIIKGGIKKVYLLEGADVDFDRDNPQNKIGIF